jgi:hypothetical protein
MSAQAEFQTDVDHDPTDPTVNGEEQGPELEADADADAEHEEGGEEETDDSDSGLALTDVEQPLSALASLWASPVFADVEIVCAAPSPAVTGATGSDAKQQMEGVRAIALRAHRCILVHHSPLD